MPRQTAARFLPAALLLLALPAAAQDGGCSMEASILAEPIETIPADAPIFAPLRWGMTRDQIRRALTTDGWRRDASRTEEGVDWFDGEMFGRNATAAATRNAAGRLILVSVFIEDENTFTWDHTLWNEVTGVLDDGYGPPLSVTGTASGSAEGSAYCSAFGTGGGTLGIQATWETVEAGVMTGCKVNVHYSGPGLPAHDQARMLSRARAADRTCRADIARERRDRDRLAPGTARRPARTRPAETAPPPPPPPPPSEVLDFSEVSPQMVGGLPALQQSVQYPDFEKRAGLEGTVVLRFIVTPEGRAEDVSVTRGVSPGLDAAAIAAVQRMRYTPGRQNGQPVRVRMTAPVRFTIR